MSFQEKIKQIFNQKRQKIRDTFRELDAVDLDILESNVLAVYEADEKERTQKLQPHLIVTLIGTTRKDFQDRYFKVARELCLKGYLVISVNVFQTDVEDIQQYRETLESIHLQKIRLADIVVLIHKDAIGKYTKIEMDYCKEINKTIVTFDNIAQADAELKKFEGLLPKP